MRHACRASNCVRGVAYAGGLCDQHRSVRERRALVWTRFKRTHPLLRFTWRSGAFVQDGDLDLAIYGDQPIGAVELGTRAFLALS